MPSSMPKHVLNFTEVFAKNLHNFYNTTSGCDTFVEGVLGLCIYASSKKYLGARTFILYYFIRLRSSKYKREKS